MNAKQTTAGTLPSKYRTPPGDWPPTPGYESRTILGARDKPDPSLRARVIVSVTSATLALAGISGVYVCAAFRINISFDGFMLLHALEILVLVSLGFGVSARRSPLVKVALAVSTVLGLFFNACEIIGSFFAK